MPMLGIDRNKLYWKEFFLNCYIGIKEYPQKGDKFFLLFKFNNTQDYLKVRELLKEEETFSDEMAYSSPNGEYVIFMFKVNKKFNKEYRLFKEGKYSQFSNEYKNLIMRVHLVTQDKLLYHILNKTEKRRKQLSNDWDYPLSEKAELWSLPRDEDEILTLKNL